MTPDLPLLHIAQAANRVTSVDDRLLLLAAVVFAAAAAFIWWAPLRVLLGRPFARRGLRAGMVLLAFFALLPSVFPYDHVLNDPSHAAEHEQVHKTHCHGTPGQCADAPMPSGPGQMLGSDVLLPAAPTLAVLMALAATPLVGISWRPLLRPPLLPAAA